MLGEGRRAKERGRDVVVGFVETHGRVQTAALLDDLEILPARSCDYRGGEFTELDVDAVLARAPKVVLVDELAHTNVPGSRHAKRWQDVEEILDAGIHVITTVNVQHLESLNDVVHEITGVPQLETVPDEMVRQADQIELVDMSPDALRRRMAHGNIYAPEKVDAALSNYFRVGNLTALRELALLWVGGQGRRTTRPLPLRTRDPRARGRPGNGVVVALTGGPEGDTLVRRAARIADRSKGADLLALHVVNADGLTGGDPANLARQRTLAESLGGTYHQVVGDDIPKALLDFASGVNATQLVLGASRRGRFAQILSRGVGVETTAQSGSIDVHMITHAEAKQGRARRQRSRAALARHRRITGWTMAVAGMPALAGVLLPFRAELSPPSEILFFLMLTVGVALVGGTWPAITAAVGGSLLLNYFFTPPCTNSRSATPRTCSPWSSSWWSRRPWPR